MCELIMLSHASSGALVLLNLSLWMWSMPHWLAHPQIGQKAISNVDAFILINTSAVCSQARSLSPLRLASIGRSHPDSRGAFEFFLCIADRAVVDLVVHANPSWLTRRTIMLSIDQQCCRSNFNIDHFSPSVGFDPMTLSLLPQARQPLGDLVATTSQCRYQALATSWYKYHGNVGQHATHISCVGYNLSD